MPSQTPTTFGSVELDRPLRMVLLDRLAAAHAEQPLAADDPRGTAGRVSTHVTELGLQVERIRGTVSVAGVEVDHVWLAVRADGDGPDRWVLDAAFPLLDPSFVGLLAGWVAGTTSTAELAASAAGAGVDRRVLGRIPDRATYRGQPVWRSRDS